VLDRLAAELGAHPLADPDPETQHCARLLLTLHRRGEGAGKGRIADTHALRAVRLLQRAFADQPRELPVRVALGRTLAGLRVDPDSPDLLDARADHAQALGEFGQVEAAGAACAALLADLRRILGQDHPDTLKVRNSIAYFRAQSGEVAAALEDSTGLLADRERILGPDHPGTLNVRNNIAYWRAESGEIAAALADFELLLADKERVLDIGHPDLQLTRDWIAHLRKRLDTRSPNGTGDYRNRWSNW